jgi:hypothetical protein
MREITVRSGRFSGTHKIYENKAEAISLGIEAISPWFSPVVEPGDWVVSDDGYVVQCLDRYVLRNKRHQSGQYTDVLRFPQGSFWVYHRKDGKQNIKSFLAFSTNTNKNSLGDTPKGGKFMTPRKKLFVSLIIGGMDPLIAYKIAFKVGPVPIFSLTTRVNRLLMDENIRAELMEQTQVLVKAAEDQIKEMTGVNSIKELVAVKLAQLAADPDISNKDTIAYIKLLAFLFPEALNINKETKSKPADSVSYVEVKPPLGEINGSENNNNSLISSPWSEYKKSDEAKETTKQTSNASNFESNI